MLYLAFQVLTASTDPKAAVKAKPLNFLQATMFQWVNPKAWLMLIGAISIFSIHPNYYNNALAISALYFLVLLPSLSVWLVFGAVLKKILKEERHRRWFNIIMAICLVASIGLMVRD
jgi:threonine/homoserine/homoserine lactone efflux protein